MSINDRIPMPSSKAEQDAMIKGLLYEHAVEEELRRRKKPEYQHDYALIDDMIEEIRQLGYNVKYYTDIISYSIIRTEIVEVILKYIDRFENRGFTAELVSSIGNKNNKHITARIIELYNSEYSDFDVKNQRPHLSVFFDNAFNRLKDKRYIDDYIGWLADPEIAVLLPVTMYMLARWKLPEAQELFIRYLDYEDNDSIVTLSIKALSYYKDEESKELIRSMQESENAKISEFARLVYAKMK